MKIIRRSSALTSNIRPIVPSRTSDRYSPTCSVNLPDSGNQHRKNCQHQQHELQEIRQRIHDQQAVQRVGGSVMGEREHRRHQAAHDGNRRPGLETPGHGFATHRNQIHRQHHQHRDGQGGFRRGCPQDFEVVHNEPPFSSRSNSGEFRQGWIQFNNKPGKSPMTSEAAMSITAPMRSGAEMGSNGWSCSDCRLAARPNKTPFASRATCRPRPPQFQHPPAGWFSETPSTRP